MLEASFFFFTHFVFRPVRGKSRHIRLPANVFILDLSKVFCFVVKCRTNLSDRMHFLLPM